MNDILIAVDGLAKVYGKRWKQVEAVRTVYAVEISLDNPDLALKPGVIADVTFGAAG